MLLSLLAFALVPPAADTVRYEVAFPNAVHHEARVTVTFPAGRRDTLEIWMSRSSPGRYALHEFAKNVYDVSAKDAKGQALAVTWRDPYRWFVTGGRGPVRFSYTLFGDRADGTYTQIDATHAHMNMPATFAWAKGQERQPIRVQFAVPQGSNWRAATQLRPTADPLVFTAPHFQYFMDSPTELSNHALRSWTVAGPGGRTDTIRLAVHHLGTEAELDAFVGMAKQVVAEEIAVYGEAAPYDHGTYTFIADYLPWASSDGMEHRNSTILSSNGSLAKNLDGLLGTLAHEYFHSWNIERIRPKALEPFDFTRANASDALWFGEGFTSYYDALMVRRAGLMSDADYAGDIGGNVNALINTGGRRFFSARDMALQAPFVDAAASIDPNNRANTFLSYYTYGAAVGLGLDLTIRRGFPGKSLDGFMRLMWERYGRSSVRYEVPIPYTVADLERTLGVYTDDTAFAQAFFAQYITGREVVDYAALLAPAGFVLRPARPGAGSLGTVQLGNYDETGAQVRSAVFSSDPLYAAGLERGDRIVSVDGAMITSAEAWQSAVGDRRPGATAEVVFVRNAGGARVTARVPFVQDARLTIVPVEAAGQTLTAEQAAFRAAWLGSAVR